MRKIYFTIRENEKPMILTTIATSGHKHITALYTAVFTTPANEQTEMYTWEGISFYNILKGAGLENEPLAIYLKYLLNI